ncbi:DUF4097 family beta strand repeat-containing protein [Lysinibacillus sp. NPDC056959]|uniref:DUF4097 family beta strand repeat-containing protein n=1 Tax=Lysinibacillus sp. NPDC056959 TaxID=3345981 RepID=UPI00362D353B
MKKVVGGILICIAAITGYSFIGPGFAKVTSVQEEKEIEIDTIKDINFETTAADIKVIPSATKDMTVKLEGEIQKDLKDKYQLNIEKEGGLLKVSYLTNENSIGIKLGSEKDVTLQVSLPERAYRELLIHTTSGDIDIGSVIADSINIQTTSGDQVIKRAKANDQISMRSNSGNVEIDELFSPSGMINTKSGHVSMIIEEMMNSLDVVTTSGDVQTTFRQDPKSLKIDFKGDSGKPVIKLKNIMYEDKGKNSAIGIIGDGINTINVKTNSGDFTVE